MHSLPSPHPSTIIPLPDRRKSTSPRPRRRLLYAAISTKGMLIYYQVLLLFLLFDQRLESHIENNYLPRVS